MSRDNQWTYRPRIVEALQVTDGNVSKIKKLLGDNYLHDAYTPGGGIKMIIVRGFAGRKHVASHEDYIVVDNGKVLKPLDERDFNIMFYKP